MNRRQPGRATASFSSGIHSWEVHIDKCVSKNIFVGVVSAAASIENYVGSDRYGWGYLANKAIWHNKGKSRSYGELFRQAMNAGVEVLPCAFSFQVDRIFWEGQRPVHSDQSVIR